MEFTTSASTMYPFHTTDLTNTCVLDEYSCSPFKDDTAVIKGVKISSYCFLMICAVLGNSMVIAIVDRNKRMQTLTNYLIANMAVSDMLMTVLAVPLQLTEILFGPRRWLVDGLLGSILCKSVYFLQDISSGVSILSLGVIAIDRYRGIVFPFREPIVKRKHFKVIISLIWIVPMGIHSPYFYTFRLGTKNNETYCTYSWAPKFDERKTQEMYYLMIFSCLIVLPTCVVIVLYSLIITTLRRGLSRYNSSSRRVKEDSKIVRNILAILFGFVFCLTPMNVYAMLLYFVWKWEMPCGMENFGFAAHYILFSNAFVNPCIYFTLNDKYRRGLKDILKSIFNGWKKTRWVQTSYASTFGFSGRKRTARENDGPGSARLVELTTFPTTGK